ncbi:hypothetical protein J0910_30725 [Nocardiopsis sp. CNT-189]|uniref:hypothetical protein n=1 Tax=Nocardiopsis oceanisediminis TaxID=2816862 RepID=UPI003B394B3F
MRVSEYFGIDRKQSELDFVDVDVIKDTPVYIDPSCIRWLSDDWSEQCNIMLTTYFDSLLDAVRQGDRERTLDLLAKLREPNETHLGISKGKSAGRALGAKSIRTLGDKLAESRAAQTGLIEDLEDTALFIDGVGRDVISDITTNILRGTLINYTQSVSRFYDIPTEEVPSGFVWDPSRQEWEEDYTELPTSESGKLLLVPKVIVRNGLHLKKDEFLRNYLVPTLIDEELDNPSSKLVQTVKEGDRTLRKVNPEDVIEHYGMSKEDVNRLSVERPELVFRYRETKKKSRSLPLGHSALASATNSDDIDYDELLRAVIETPTGFDHAHDYHDRVESLLSALLYPELSFPTKEEKLHNGRKRVDIQYTNTSQRGFFSWLIDHRIPSRYIFVECKNYERDLGNPELDQISSRFSPLRGKVGLLVCREFKEKELFLKRCRDTALDHRGYIIVLDDSDLAVLVDDAKRASTPPRERKKLGIKGGEKIWEFPRIRARFNDLVS